MSLKPCSRGQGLSSSYLPWLMQAKDATCTQNSKCSQKHAASRMNSYFIVSHDSHNYSLQPRCCYGPFHLLCGLKTSQKFNLASHDVVHCSLDLDFALLHLLAEQITEAHK